MIQIKHRGWAKKLAKFNLRYGRGNGHMSWFYNALKLTAYYTILKIPLEYMINKWIGQGMFNKEWNFILPYEWGFIGALIYFIVCYFIGWLDEKVGFWKQEAAYSVEELNPPFKKAFDQIESYQTLFEKQSEVLERLIKKLK